MPTWYSPAPPKQILVELTRIGVGVIGTAAVNGSGTWSFDYSVTTLTEGTHQFSATARDATGNSNPPRYWLLWLTRPRRTLP